jgi:hypothetical protein
MNLLGTAADLVAILVMVFGIYFPRHRRRDMLVAYLMINIGLVCVTSALVAQESALSIGFGLFAVLSLIRLRSSELDQPEVAYYLAAMMLGLIGALSLTPEWVAPTLMALILLALFVGDHPRLFARYRVQTLTLDQAILDEGVLIGHLEQLLKARVYQVKVRRTDLIDESTVVEVRYRIVDAQQGEQQG